jgi:hypothetical protein
MSTESTRSELLQQLRELGVESVTAEYNGSRDEGQIETPEFGPTEVPDDVVTAAEHLFYELLERLYGGWEDNEGAFGHFRWDVGNDRVNLVHNTWTESYETEEQNL